MSKILVVDDEQSICWGFVKLGESMGHNVVAAASAEEGLQLAAKSSPDLLVLDVRLPGMDGLTALQHFREHIGNAPIIIITAFGDLQTAVKTVQAGAFEYIIKPFDLAEVRSAIERALHKDSHATTIASVETDDEMIGCTPVMQELFKRIALAAASDANVLVRGESGVGKELAARAIHRHSKHSISEFVAVNVAALSPTLAESELFGHVDGAFTGARRSREGLLVKANGGTLFLDEVADIPLPLQVKLLRAIEQGEVLPVGADMPVKTSFRVVAATHQDLQALIQTGEFRHDLFFRICAFEIEIPALRERAEDIPLLASHFASQLSEGKLAFAEDAISEIKRRSWYGNVRELRNAIEHALVVARSGYVLPEHLPQPQPCMGQLQSTTNGSPALSAASHQRAQELLNDPEAAGSVYDRFLSEVEAPLLADAMELFDNECAPAARALGLHRTTLKKKLVQHNISPHQ
ncbi:MAG: sigma-54 dependent transcriptional regulator [Pirellulales bacterium]|nr:sigma-54 dependent transcriptional regulator [Pirellulales bacterium]